MGGNGSLLAAHLVYILVIAAWVLGIMLPFFYTLNWAGLMRVQPEVERDGLDVSYHGGSSYPHERAASNIALGGVVSGRGGQAAAAGGLCVLGRLLPAWALPPVDASLRALIPPGMPSLTPIGLSPPLLSLSLASGHDK